MKLLLFGGTFDPPHVGHMSLLCNAVATVNPDVVVVMPAGVPPHKGASTTPWELRAEMCACFRAVFEPLVISDLEMARGGKSYTFETVRELKKQYPGYAIYLCMGSDMLLSFTTWRNWEELLREVTLVGQNRREEDAKPTAEAAAMLRAKGAKIVFASGEVEPVSSTVVRTAIGAGYDLAGIIPPPADMIVKKNRLYKTAVKP